MAARSSGRRRRHQWSGGGRAHIEVRAARRPGTERFAREVEAALTRIEGVHSAQVNAVLGRVVVSFEEGVDLAALVEAVEAVEEAHDLADETFGFDRPDFPGDVEPMRRAAVALLADAVGVASGIAGSLLAVPAIPDEVAALFALVDSQPRLRRYLENAVGPIVTDIGLNVANAVAQGLAQGPLGPALDSVHRAGLLDEAAARFRSWERVEPQLGASPAPAQGPLVAGPKRPVPLPGGPVERHADYSGLGALAGAIATFGLTTDIRRAGSVMASGVPKAGRLGREAFCQRLGRALSERDELVFDPVALRRLDRVDTVMIDTAILFTGRKEIDAVQLLGDIDRAQGQRRLRSLFDPDDAGAVRRQRGWSIGPLAELADPAELGDRAHRRHPRPGAFTHGLMSNKGLVAEFSLRDEMAPGWRELVEVARNGGYMIAVAGDRLDLVDRFQAHMLVPGGDELCDSVRMLQRDGCGVVLICGPCPAALKAADCGVGLAMDGVFPWGADVLAKDLGTATFLVEAAAAARSVSRQSANLAALGTVTGALLGLASPAPQATSRVMTSQNVAGFVSVANGLRAGVSLARQPRRRHRSGPPWHELDAEEVLALLKATDAARAAQGGDLGSNVDPGATRGANGASGPARFASAVASELSNPLTPVLVSGAAVSAAVGSTSDAVMVGAVSALNALIGGAVRFRAENAVRSLDRHSQQQVRVRRGRRREIVPADSLVPGDVVLLSAGDAVPADCRIIEAVNLEVDESSITGESLPVTKSAAPSFSSLVAERTSMLYAESSVIAGRASAVVVAVGDDTEAAAGDFTLGAPVAVGAEARLGRLTALSVPLAALGGATVVGSELLRGRPLSASLGDAVSLAVAAVPEGLPVVATMAQLAAARRLSKRGALVRNPRALEALARVDVLCTDKTGTLTGGRVVLTSVWDGHRRYPIDRLGGHAGHTLAAALRATPPARAGSTLQMTDRAIVEGAGLSAVEATLGAAEWQFEAELPFEPNRGFHATVGSVGPAYLLSVKGAPEVVMARCERWRDGTGQRPIDAKKRRALAAMVDRLARTGLRLLAVAEAPAPGPLVSDADVGGLTFLGLLALSDPVRPSAALAVVGLQRAGVDVVMVTGDHASTAESVAVELGLLNGHQVMTGAELARLSDPELDRALPDVAVFARVAPADKVRIVAAFRRAGRTVAMTGDGANDAPAIRLADVGIALGQHSTTAARMAADVVITDDRIETVLDAVTEGRGMWASVREAVAVLVGGNAGEVLFTSLTSVLAGRVPLSTRQLLLVNLMTDVVPSMAIAVQPPRRRSPEQLRAEGPDRSLSGAMYQAIAERAVTTAAGAGTAWAISSVTGRRRRANTVALAALVGTQLGQTIVAGNGNPLVLAASLGSAGLLAAIVETPGVSQFFGCTPIGPVGWATALTSSAAATGASMLLSPRRRGRAVVAPGAPLRSDGASALAPEEEQ